MGNVKKNIILMLWVQDMMHTLIALSIDPGVWQEYYHHPISNRIQNHNRRYRFLRQWITMTRNWLDQWIDHVSFFVAFVVPRAMFFNTLPWLPMPRLGYDYYLQAAILVVPPLFLLVLPLIALTSRGEGGNCEELLMSAAAGKILLPMAERSREPNAFLGPTPTLLKGYDEAYLADKLNASESNNPKDLKGAYNDGELKDSSLIIPSSFIAKGSNGSVFVTALFEDDFPRDVFHRKKNRR